MNKSPKCGYRPVSLHHLRSLIWSLCLQMLAVEVLHLATPPGREGKRYVTNAVFEFDVASRSGHFNLRKKRGGCSYSIVFLVSHSFTCLAATILPITKRVWIYRPLLTGRHIESFPQREGTSALMRLPVRDVHHFADK